MHRGYARSHGGLAELPVARQVKSGVGNRGLRVFYLNQGSTSVCRGSKPNHGREEKRKTTAAELMYKGWKKGVNLRKISGPVRLKRTKEPSLKMTADKEGKGKKKRTDRGNGSRHCRTRVGGKKEGIAQ